jgi:death-on-curing protein
VSFDPKFVSVEDVLYIHEKQLEKYGGSDGIRDRGLLESAIATPQASFGGQFVHEDLYHMSAAYAFHIAENQPFIDGNKRTGLAAALVFLEFNEIALDDPRGKLYQAMLQISARKLDKPGFARLLQKLAVRNFKLHDA